MNLILEAQQFLLSAHNGILSTHSIKYKGYPFGSVTPFVLNHEGMPTILISTIAEHTKNIIQDNKVSLIVFTNQEDLQANARLTLLATASLTDKNNALMRERYLRYIPQAEQYFDMHDFHFYTLHITNVRYIAGFGKMGWIEGESMQLSKNQLYEAEPDILAHMNSDHAENLIAYCKHFHHIQPKQVEMIGIDSLGFDVRINHGQDDDHHTQLSLRFQFEAPINNAQEARAALVEMAKSCRT